MDVYEGIMQGLNEAIAYNEGKIKARTKTMSIEPIPDFKAAEIKQIRNELGMTQVLFAGFMGVSTKTVEAWEAGKSTPTPTAKKLMFLIQEDHTLIQKL